MSNARESPRPFHYTSAFDPTPDHRSDEAEAEEYLRASREKLAIAERQLRQLKDEEARLDADGFAEAMLGDDDNLRLIEGFGDTIIVELYGAFDAFACATAYRAGHGNPDAAEFAGLSLKERVQPLCGVMNRIQGEDQWKNLVYYRNLAAHKEVLAKGAWRDETGIHRLRLPERLPANSRSSGQRPPHPPSTPVVPILDDLAAWARRRLPELWDAFAKTFPALG